MSRLRVVVATDRIGHLDSLAAGTAVARGFAEHAAVAVVPLAAGGPDLASAVAALTGAEAEVERDRWCVRTPGLSLCGQRDADPDSAGFGRWVAACAGDAPRVVLDLTGLNAQDGGAGLLAAARSVLEGRRLVGVVAADELALPATGIGGGLAKRAFADRVDVADLLRADAALVAWADRLAPGLATAPGGGAAGTTALAVLALGGELVSGTQFCHRQAGLGGTLAAADLVVTGCSELSALDRGGPVVSAVTGWAADAQLPCVLFTTGAGLARRELRTLGLEAAHLLASATPSEADLTAAAARIATGWVST